MPPPPTAVVSYKKKDGSLSISADHKYLFFTPAAPPNSSPSVTVPVSDITNLQQTPESSPKVALKVFVKDDNYVFSFTSKDSARKEQEAVTDTLRNTIATNKASSAAQFVPSSSASTPAPSNQQSIGENGDGGHSAAMAIAKAVASRSNVDESWYDDSKLKTNAALQSSLLEADKTLQARFKQAKDNKPENVSLLQFNSQFWSTRLHLLRAHAIEKAQKQGEYNVLPEIRFVRKAAEKEGEPDTKELRITREQILLIFRQYPVVKEAFDENTPKPLDQNQFWQRFFGSRLLKKLKGEKILPQDPFDSILDKYLDRREPLAPGVETHVPHFIDLEGNEQNHSQRKGNRPDQDMRPSSFDKVPILRVLNNLSEKMLSKVAPEDGDAHGPIGMDEETYGQLRLRDLAAENEDHTVKLHVREQQRHLGSGDDLDDLSHDAKLYAKQDPVKVLSRLKLDLQPSNLGSDKHGTLRLDRVIGYTSDSSSDSDEDTPMHEANGTTTLHPRKAAAIGSHKAMTSASTAILSSITQRRTAASTDPTSLNGLSQATFDQLTIAHNTTTEFLHYFWTLFLSGDSSRTAELGNLVSTLDRSVDRINAVAEMAEAERSKRVESKRAQMKEVEKKTGKRPRWDLDAIPGGKAVVDAMARPTTEALRQAIEVYRKALEEQTKDVAMNGGV